MGKVINEYHSVLKNEYIFYINKKDLTPLNFLKLKQASNKYLQRGKNVRYIVIDNLRNEDTQGQVNYIYSKKQLDLLEEMNNYLLRHNNREVEIIEDSIKTVDSFKSSYTFSQIKKVNNIINNQINRINKAKLTNFEAMIYIHTYLKENFVYTNHNNDIIKVSNSRMIPDILFNNRIVCAGYASIVKAIVDGLNKPNLKAYNLASTMYSKKFLHPIVGGHLHNLIYIKDEKYDIEGYYIEDVTADSIRLKDSLIFDDGGYANCLFSINLLNNYKKYKYDVSKVKNRSEVVLVGAGKPFDLSKTSPRLKELLKKNSEPITIDKYKKAFENMFNKAIKSEKFSIQKELEKTDLRLKRQFDLKNRR